MRSCIVLKDAFAKKLCCERTSQLYYFYMFVYIQCRRRRPTDRLHLCILSFLFPAETDVLVPVLSQSTDVVVVNFVVVLKFPNPLSNFRSPKLHQDSEVFVAEWSGESRQKPYESVRKPRLQHNSSRALASSDQLSSLATAR